MTALLAPARVGVASDGTDVYHTGLWLSPSKTLLFIGVVGEGPPAARPQRPSIVIEGGEDLKIAGFSYVMGSGPRGGSTWLLQTDIDPDHAPLLAGATLTMRYADHAGSDVVYTAPLATLS
ncbi:hypothetical protein PWY87_26920 [Kribbella solani]|uniref:hypothetical protein n=1 Tax=Kribbella solani TaxID=236067 RepID=UPI0029A7C6EB|nr:hypothetical protein [Kribbella solani]MDX3005338.1 hypothetical protein [Kribbella solani]